MHSVCSLQGMCFFKFFIDLGGLEPVIPDPWVRQWMPTFIVIANITIVNIFFFSYDSFNYEGVIMLESCA
jgi:hypothetical protein